MANEVPLKAVLWDFGGVLTSSPFDAFSAYEKAEGIPQGFIRKVNSTNPDNNAWARFERSELDAEGFDRAFHEETAGAGHGIAGGTVIGLLGGNIRPRMVAALKQCRQRFITGCLTNNVRSGIGTDMAPAAARAAAVKRRSLPEHQRLAEVMSLFHVVLQSSREGLRKPDPAFYEKALAAMRVRPEETVFLDDLGINLKPARAMGMQTIKVVSETQALAELSAVTKIDFQA